MITEQAVRDALRNVIDPEVGVNVVDLGLVYSIAIEAGAIRVQLAMTTPACPLVDHLVSESEAAIGAAVPATETVSIEVVDTPPWTPDMMSDVARQQLGWTH